MNEPALIKLLKLLLLQILLLRRSVVELVVQIRVTTITFNYDSGMHSELKDVLLQNVVIT